jgi:hypothetical protein
MQSHACKQHTLEVVQAAAATMSLTARLVHTTDTFMQSHYGSTMVTVDMQGFIRQLAYLAEPAYNIRQ